MNSISVIVPVYNTEKYLQSCIDSILAQRQYICEIILMDDGSTDQCPAICDEYARLWPDLVAVIHQANQGSSVARNCAIDRAKGMYLSFIDSDDYIEPDMYERLLNQIENNSADMACCATISYVYNNGFALVTYPTTNGNKTRFVKLSAFIDISFSKYSATMNASSITYRKSDLSTAFGNINSGTSVTVVGKSGSNTQIIYASGDKYYLAWVPSSSVK